MNKSFIDSNALIICWDFNLSLAEVEIWGQKAIPNPLEDFFVQTFERNRLLDIYPIKIKSTWCKRRMEANRIVKDWAGS